MGWWWLRKFLARWEVSIASSIDRRRRLLLLLRLLRVLSLGLLQLIRVSIWIRRLGPSFIHMSVYLFFHHEQGHVGSTIMLLFSLFSLPCGGGWP
jgi:hypothetical protein